MFEILIGIVSAATSLGVAAYAFRHRNGVPAARRFALSSLFLGLQTAGYLVETMSPAFWSKIFWDDAQWVTSVLASTSALLFAVQYTGLTPRNTRPLNAVVGVLLVACLGLVLTNPLHGFVHTGERLAPGDLYDVLVYPFGPGSWVVAGYIYAMLAATLMILMRGVVRADPKFRVEVALVMLGFLALALISLLPFTGLLPPEIRDTSPLAFAAGSAFSAWALFRHRLFDVIPLAGDAAITNIPDAVITTDALGRVVRLNPMAQAALGFTERAASGRRLADVLAVFPGLRERCPLPHAPPGDPPHVLTTESGGRYFDVTVTTMFTRGDHPQGHVVVIRDVTSARLGELELVADRDALDALVGARTAELERANQELKREIGERKALEEQFRQTQKMEALGRLAGGVAHDFNNLLTAILGYSDRILTRDTAPDTTHAATQIRKAALSAAELTGRLLAFSRKQVLTPTMVDLNQIVRETLGILARLLREDVEVRTSLDPELSPVLADRGQLEQVILNLAVNARDAMPGGGLLSLETGAVTVAHELAVSSPDLRAGSYSVLRVRDTGVGMEPEVLKHLFEPFFTTKDSGKGTGLGLAMVHGVVTQSGGAITVSSTPANGSCFTVYLPAAPAVHAPAPVAPPVIAAPGSGTVLVVEDEPLVRELMVEILSGGGYTVLQAVDGETALTAASEGDPIDLLVTDVILPGGVSGPEVASRLRAARAGLRVLFVSGHTADHVDDAALRGPGTGFVQKPFTPEELLAGLGRLASDGVR